MVIHTAVVVDRTAIEAASTTDRQVAVEQQPKAVVEQLQHQRYANA